MSQRKKIEVSLDSEFFLELTILTGFFSVDRNLNEAERDILDLAYHEMKHSLQDNLTEEEIVELSERRKKWMD